MKREKLIRARLKKGLSQEVAAELIGVSRNAWSLWELGKEDPYPLNIGELCKFFGVKEPSELDLGPPQSRTEKAWKDSTTSHTLATLFQPQTSTQIKEEEALSPLAQAIIQGMHLACEQLGDQEMNHLRRRLLQLLLGITEEAVLAPSSPIQADQQVSEEWHYLDLAMQILEMAIREYQWSSDVVQSKVIHGLRNVLKKSNSGEISRRQLVLFGTGAILTLSNTLVLVPEEILPFCTQNIATCWQMSNGGRDDLTHTRWMISSYLPTLTTLATQSSPHQKLAASQAAACYCLRSLLDYHIENLAVAEEDAKQFIYYSKLTEDPEWIVRAHVRFALVSYYRDRPEQALVACREANRYKNQAPPAALFSLYKQQATYEAQVGLKDEATASLHLAYDNLLRTTHGQSHAYVDTNLYEWALWKGITHYHLGEYKESKDILESVDPLNPDSFLPERVRTGILNNLIFAELRAKERDIERCIMVWKNAVEWAKKLQSELRLAEVRRAYDWLLLVFPHESRVTALKELIT